MVLHSKELMFVRVNMYLEKISGLRIISGVKPGWIELHWNGPLSTAFHTAAGVRKAAG